MEEKTNTSQTVQVVDIQFRPGQKIYFFDPAGVNCAEGDHVIIDTARGEEYGICAGGVHSIPVRDVVSPLRRVLRKAGPQDERIVAENRAKEARAAEICGQKIAAHGLDMQLVSVECTFDGSKLLFYFTADERVDFRELVKDLASVFHTRIELRQIGVRDKAKMVGGLGICGRPFCCASFLDDFQPVSIKMAKSQNLSLNPTKISGTCGRLMCCLKYEQDTYEELIRSSPKVESLVDTVDGRGTVVEVDILRQRVKVRMEANPETVAVYNNSDVAVLRSGKARKNDAPIPAEVAPLSGGARRPARKEPEQEETMALAPIKFRYSTEPVVEEPAEQPARPAKSRSRRERSEGKKKNRPAKDQPQEPENVEAKPPRGPKEPKEAREPREPREPKGKNPPEPREGQETAEPGAEKPRRPRNRRNYRRPRGKKPENVE